MGEPLIFVLSPGRCATARRAKKTLREILEEHECRTSTSG